MANLTDPVKTPLVVISDASGNIITNSLGVDGLYVVDMRYTFDDEDDDICAIKLRADNSLALDRVRIQYGTVLRIQWGYIGGPVSPKTTVVVRDINTKYGTNTIWVKLDCADFVTYLKTTRGTNSSEASILEYLQDKCTNLKGYSYKVTIKEFGKIVYKQDKVKTNPEVEAMSMNPDQSDNPFASLTPQPEIDPYQEGWKLIRIYQPNVPDNGKLYKGASPKLLAFFEKKRSFTDGNRSPFQVLRDTFKYAPNGPWYISGRGDSILIHNRDLAASPTRTYTYQKEPGLLMDLSIVSKFEAFEQRSVTSQYMNPEEKIAYYEEIYIKELENLKDLKKILLDTKISNDRRKELLKDFLSVYRASTQYKMEQVLLYASVSGGRVRGNLMSKDPNDLYGPYMSEVYDKQGNFSGAAMKYAGPTGSIWDPDKIQEIQEAFPFIVHLLPGQSTDEVKHMIDNVGREAEMDKIEARLILEGDPLVISEIIVRITNIQQIHSGDFYIKKVEHIVSSNGFKVNCEGFKILPKAAMMGLSMSAESSEDAQKVIERSHREEALFNGWDLEIYVSSKKYTSVTSGRGAGGITQVSGSQYESLSKYINDRSSLPVDELVDEIIGRKIRTTIKSNIESR